jgi:hypothetical protein
MTFDDDDDDNDDDNDGDDDDNMIVNKLNHGVSKTSQNGIKRHQ